MAAMDVLLSALAEDLWAEFHGRRFRRLSPSRSASDLIQDTLIRAGEKFSGFNKDTYSEFRQWARSILYNLVLQCGRDHHTHTSERMLWKVWRTCRYAEDCPGKINASDGLKAA